MVGLSPIIDQGNPVNRSHPLNRGRVAWWLAAPQLNGSGYGSPTWRDLLGVYPVALTAAPPWRGAPHPGGQGSLSFDGSTQYGSNATALMMPTAFVWVRPRGGNGTAGYPVASAWNFGNGIRVVSPSAGFVTFGAPAVSGDTTQTFATGVWYRVGYVGTTFYVNGLPYAVDSAQGPFFGLGGVVGTVIGAERTDLTFPLVGDVDDVALWNYTPADANAFAWADYDLSRRGYPGVLNTLPATRAFASAGAADTLFAQCWC